ncbi:MAG TPA: endonuclease III [Vicinamibacterales bacterium]|nr:endonuclease III [Vicinamibacterales bacterium]
MKSPADALAIFDALDEQHPGADTELHFTDAYQLLTATILSAQSTDQRVNMVTPALFRRYPTPAALAAATQEELEPQIHSTGFFRAKSKSLLGMARALVERHHGAVPADMEALTALPGVGRKTANVVLGHALGVPGLPVDRHVLRVANRIGLADGDDPEKVEAQLCALLPRERWTRASDCLILHGRRVCRPTPLCPTCLVQEYCAYFKTGETTDPRRRAVTGRSSSDGPATKAVRTRGASKTGTVGKAGTARRAGKAGRSARPDEARRATKAGARKK